MMFGWRVNPHFGPFHLLSFAFIGGGFVMISAGWKVLHRAQRHGQLADTGIYARVRHPQYDGFVLVMFGFLLQWPTILTLAMFPALVFMYLASGEDRGTRTSRPLARRIATIWKGFLRSFPASARMPTSEGSRARDDASRHFSETLLAFGN